MLRLFKIAIGLFLVGVGVVAIFSILSEDSIFASVNDEDFVYHELSYDADDFDKLYLIFENRDFIIGNSESANIEITYYTTEKDPVEVTENGSTLELINDIEWYNTIFTGWDFLTNDEYYDVYIYLPTTAEYEIYLVDANGTIDVADMANFSDLYLATSNGRITVENVSADNIDMISSNGELRVTDLVVSEDLGMITSNGRIYLTNVVADTISSRTSNGKIIATSIHANDIDLDTSNGDIEVGVAGAKEDYEIYMSTSNGDMVYDGLEITSEHVNATGTYMVHLNTSNGDIVVTFAE